MYDLKLLSFLGGRWEGECFVTFDAFVVKKDNEFFYCSLFKKLLVHV